MSTEAIGAAFYSIWCTMLCVPVLVAVVCWKTAKRTRVAGLVHLLFAPCLLGAEWLLIWLMAAVVGNGGEPGLGFALLPIFLAVMLALAGYYVGVLVTWVRARSEVSTSK